MFLEPRPCAGAETATGTTGGATGARRAVPCCAVLCLNIVALEGSLYWAPILFVSPSWRGCSGLSALEPGAAGGAAAAAGQTKAMAACWAASIPISS